MDNVNKEECVKLVPMDGYYAEYFNKPRRLILIDELPLIGRIPVRHEYIPDITENDIRRPHNFIDLKRKIWGGL